jgi:hypothetical protein
MHHKALPALRGWECARVPPTDTESAFVNEEMLSTVGSSVALRRLSLLTIELQQRVVHRVAVTRF